MRKGKAAGTKLLLSLAVSLAAVLLAGAMCGRATAQSGCITTRSEYAVGGTIRACPVDVPPGPSPTPHGPSRGPGIRPGPRPGPRITRPVQAPPDPVAAELNQGDNFYNSGNYTAALWHYRQALAAHPGDQNILNRIANANQQIQNAEHNRQLAEEAARRQREAEARLDYAEKTQQLANKFEGILSEDFNASFDGNRQSAVLAEALPNAGLDFSPPSLPVVTPHTEAPESLSFTSPEPAPADKPVYFPALKSPVSPNSTPGRVLLANQTEVSQIDEQLRQAQESLRRLIETNKATDEQRHEWEKESEEATTDAEGLSIKLVLDLAGGFNDELKDAQKEEQQEVLQKILNRTPEEATNPNDHTLYAMLVDRKEQLERRSEKLRLTGKLMDLSDKIENGDKPIDEKAQYAVWIANWQAVWDTVSQSKKVEDLTGPWADILDSAYTIYRQADSLDHLAQLENNDNKVLAAQASLQRLVRQLVLKKQAAKARAAVSHTKPAAEAHR